MFRFSYFLVYVLIVVQSSFHLVTIADLKLEPVQFLADICMVTIIRQLILHNMVVYEISKHF